MNQNTVEAIVDKNARKLTNYCFAHINMMVHRVHCVSRDYPANCIVPESPAKWMKNGETFKVQVGGNLGYLMNGEESIKCGDFLCSDSSGYPRLIRSNDVPLVQAMQDAGPGEVFVIRWI